MKSFLLTILLLSGSLSTLFSQNLLRGPYLQSPTENSVVIKWRTSSNTNSKVLFGTDSSNLLQSVVLNNNTTEHTIKLTNLAPSTLYYYSVGNSITEFTIPSAQYHFRTNPVPGTPIPTRVWAIGDFGKGNSEQVAVKNSYMNFDDSAKTDVWIWLGDNVYNDGKDEEYQTKLFELNGFSDVFHWLPFWPSPGNHDYNTIWQQSTFLGVPYTNIDFNDHEGPYYDLVHVPTEAEAGGYPSQYELFYSFDYGDVHFLSLNSEVYDFTQTFDGINQMKAWIEQDLSQNNRTFTIAYFHQPPYSKGSHDSDDLYEQVMKAMREKVVPLLESYDIDLVICGHSHVFERSKLIHGHYGYSDTYDPLTMLKDGSNGNYGQGNAYMKDGLSTTPDGTVYVVCGNSGSKEDAPALNHPIMEFVDGGSEACGSFILDIYRNRLDGKYLHMNGSVLDEFTILKTNLTFTIPDIFVCEGEQISVEPIITGGSDSLTYVWSLNGETTSSVIVGTQNAGTNQLIITDMLTGQQVTQTFSVFVATSLSIQVSGDTLFAQGTSGTYQWYLNGNPIFGATNPYLIANSSGSYTVGSAGGSCISSAVFIDINSADTPKGNSVVVIYPNPAGEEIYISLPPQYIGKAFQLYNSEGVVVKKGRFSADNNSVWLTDLSSGAYNLRISGLKKSFRFVKN
ncbi:MAG: hypothetical protein RIT43_977 [Bacteroidota bacterium]|jgi:hypothetical protein